MRNRELPETAYESTRGREYDLQSGTFVHAHTRAVSLENAEFEFDELVSRLT
jgi:hypothetical protein